MAMSTRSKTATASGAAASPARPTITKKRNSRQSAQSSSDTPAASSSGPSVLPDVALLCDDGESRSLHSFFDDKPGLVIFTYPRANTPGCTTQASGLSDFVDEAAKKGYAIVGASYDSVKSQASWKAKLSLKCRLLCDTLEIGFLKKMGAHKAPKSVKRSVFIIARGDGDSKSPGPPTVLESRIVISPKDSIAFVKEYVQGHPQNQAATDAPEPSDPAKSAEDKDGAQASS